MPTKRTVRWVAPAAVVVAIGGGLGINSALSAGAAPSLPHRSAQQLLVDAAQAKVPGMSGTVVEKANLGLPDLPAGVSGSGSSSLQALISGSHTLRIWAGDDGKFRVAQIGTLGESDVIRNGRDVWIWSSQNNSAAHYTLPAAKKTGTKAGNKAAAKVQGPMANATPQQVAKHLLQQVDPTTAVTVDGTQSVAGRATYTLRVKPKDPSTLVDQIAISIDAKKHVPLEVRVTAKGQTKPAIDIAFTHVDFTAPDARQFTFNPPPGAKVTTPSLKSMFGTPLSGQRASGADTPKTVGTGWSEVLVATGVDLNTHHLRGRGGAITEVLRNLPHVSGTWGTGRLLTSALVDAVITDDGRVAVGMVQPAKLYSALGR